MLGSKGTFIFEYQPTGNKKTARSGGEGSDEARGGWFSPVVHAACMLKALQEDHLVMMVLKGKPRSVRCGSNSLTFLRCANYFAVYRVLLKR